MPWEISFDVVKRKRAPHQKASKKLMSVMLNGIIMVYRLLLRYTDYCILQNEHKWLGNTQKEHRVKNVIFFCLQIENLNLKYFSLESAVLFRESVIMENQKKFHKFVNVN